MTLQHFVVFWALSVPFNAVHSNPIPLHKRSARARISCSTSKQPQRDLFPPIAFCPITIILVISITLIQCPLIPKQTREELRPRGFLPGAAVLHSHEILQLLVHIVPHFAALGRLGVNFLGPGAGGVELHGEVCVAGCGSGSASAA